MQANLGSDSFCGYNSEAAISSWTFQPGQYNNSYAIGEVGVFPANVAEVLHNVWFGPAAAVVGVVTPVIVTVDVDAAQGAFEIVH